MARLSVELERFFLQDLTSEGEATPLPDPPPKVTLADILALAGERTFGFLFVILSLPSALPIPAPGYSIPFGIVMFLLAMQLMAGRERPWLPESWKGKGFDRNQVQGVMKAGLPWLKRVEVISRPRLTPVCTSFAGRVVIGIAIALMSVFMMIPVPGTNTLPAMGIWLTGFGLLDDDGAISLAGLTLCLIASGVVMVIFLTGATGVSAAVKYLMNLF